VKITLLGIVEQNRPPWHLDVRDGSLDFENLVADLEFAAPGLAEPRKDWK
jgi:hypothetical protein